MSSITIIFTISILIATSITNAAVNNLTVYEVIESYGFPKGILPIDVTGYELDESTGQFKAFFNGTCSFKLEGTYDLKYQSTISGVISNGKLKNLTGVSVKVFIFWLNIVEVYTTDSELGFSVGIASASFPIGNFEDCPQCGCGMDCNGAGDGEFSQLKIGRNRSFPLFRI
ncbi:uncharacterized protein At5g01610-like [Rutidosis leptorrhynchoides]|uniref:uncharacterized protein At5g01610-like n=1 Tax=Rutidosis leptorrhynchoides TaxID=125765 RepID=UPI003A99CDDD